MDLEKLDEVVESSPKSFQGDETKSENLAKGSNGHLDAGFNDNLTVDAPDLNDDDRKPGPVKFCNMQGCKGKDYRLYECCNPECSKEVCMKCFEDKYQDLTWNDHKNKMVCTKQCYLKMLRLSMAKTRWHNNGKNGKDNPNTSIRILLD